MPVSDPYTKYARQFWAIGDQVRLDLIKLLPASADCKHENNVSQLAEKLGITQPTVSHHLRILRQAGLVKNRRMCRDVYYWIDCNEWKKLIDVLNELINTPE